MRCGIVAIAFLFALAPAVADVAVDQQGIEVGIEQGHASCYTAAVAGCLFEVQTDGSPGTTSVDAYQNMKSVRLAAKPAEVDPGLAFLLPDDGIYFDASDAYVEHPVFMIVTSGFGAFDSVNPTTFGPRGNETAIGLAYPGVSAPRQEYYLAYGNDHGIGYHRAGPFNRPGGNDTDTVIGVLSDDPCLAANIPECEQTATGLASSWNSTMPNLRFGIEAYAVAVESGNGSAQNLSSPPRDSVMLSGLRELVETNRTLARQASVDRPQINPKAPSPPESRIVRIEPMRESPATVAHEPPESPADKPRHLSTALACTVFFLAWLLYSRFHGPANLLEASKRRELLELVSMSNGLRLAEAARMLSISRTSVVHHARLLEQNGLLATRRENRTFTLYTPAQAFNLSVGSPTAELPPAASAILAAIQENMEMTREALATSCARIPERTRRYWLSRLEREGRILSTGRGRSARLVVGNPANLNSS